MKYLSLERCKNHLHIEEQFDCDDWDIIAYGDAAEDLLAKVLDCELSQLEDEDGKLPKALEAALLLQIGSMYNNRESEGVSDLKINPTFQRLCDCFHDYSLNKL